MPEQTEQEELKIRESGPLNPAIALEIEEALKSWRPQFTLDPSTTDVLPNLQLFDDNKPLVDKLNPGGGTVDDIRKEPRQEVQKKLQPGGGDGGPQENNLKEVPAPNDKEPANENIEKAGEKFMTEPGEYLDDKKLSKSFIDLMKSLNHIAETEGNSKAIRGVRELNDKLNEQNSPYSFYVAKELNGAHIVLMKEEGRPMKSASFGKR
jgi:hypothetical protein